ncbi:MAG: hypothetical protein ABH813_03465 [Patescibacteria group bacterium]
MAEVMVISRKNLFTDDRHFLGFQAAEERVFDSDFMVITLRFPQWLDRDLAEKDPSYKQPIVYMMVLNCDGLVFTYQRSRKDAAYPEKRLQGKWSWGVGGHIKRVDEGSNPVFKSMRRELEEELEQIDTSGCCPHLLGYINLEEGVHAVHFGFLYVVETNLKIIKPKDPEIVIGEVKPIRDLEGILTTGYDVEEWSRVALRPLKEFLSGHR